MKQTIKILKRISFQYETKHEQYNLEQNESDLICFVRQRYFPKKIQ